MRVPSQTRNPGFGTQQNAEKKKEEKKEEKKADANQHAMSSRPRDPVHSLTHSLTHSLPPSLWPWIWPFVEARNQHAMSSRVVGGARTTALWETGVGGSGFGSADETGGD